LENTKEQEELAPKKWRMHRCYHAGDKGEWKKGRHLRKGEGWVVPGIKKKHEGDKKRKSWGTSNRGGGGE